MSIDKITKTLYPEFKKRKVYTFPKSARLLNSKEFSLVLRSRLCFRSQHFIVHFKQHQPKIAVFAASFTSARLGIALSRKNTRHAVTRNLIKRIARELFRTLFQQKLGNYDLVLRQYQRFDLHLLPSGTNAVNRIFKKNCRRELTELFEDALKNFQHNQSLCKKNR